MIESRWDFRLASCLADDLFEVTLAAQTIQKSRPTFRSNLSESYFPWKSLKHCSQKAGSLQRHHEKGGQASHVMHARIFQPRKKTAGTAEAVRRGRDINLDRHLSPSLLSSLLVPLVAAH